MVPLSAAHSALLFGTASLLLGACTGAVSKDPQGPNSPNRRGIGGDAGPAPTLGKGWPKGNEWSWDGLWNPNFPLENLLDDEYGDGHKGGDGIPTPLLPP
ncbi:MAG: hypothetical protein KC416_14505, partial [Myxococcales bacterium]|nr:hypothetical protein [Myxococcales bacterium]